MQVQLMKTVVKHRSGSLGRVTLSPVAPVKKENDLALTQFVIPHSKDTREVAQ
jgi:hypothetical protein